MASLVLDQADDQTLKHLVLDHQNLEAQPLHLAVAFRSPQTKDELTLLEVADNFSDNQVSEDKQFLRVWVAQSPEFFFHETQDLFLLLTSSREFEVALKEKWDQVSQLQLSVRAGMAMTYFADETGHGWWQRLNGE